MDLPPHLRTLNEAQRVAVEHGLADGMEGQIPGPLLIIAGAGTGKTNTLAHRVAHLILTGTMPERILLLTFTRRAAAEMTRRTQRILAAARVSKKPTAIGAAGVLMRPTDSTMSAMSWAWRRRRRGSRERTPVWRSIRTP
jgi:superfamily I DNA/RNA helicase